MFSRSNGSLGLCSANISHPIVSIDEIGSPSAQNNSTLMMFPQKGFT
jgi:hypothetical protein